MRNHRLYLVIALDCIHELGHTEDGVVVGDDQPLVRFPLGHFSDEVSENRVGLGTVASSSS